MRARIRTVKPEMRQDERYGRLSRDARELFNGLITMADDEGRFLARPVLILGHVFPFDDDAPALLDGWLAEVATSGMVVFYEHDRTPYGAFRHWRKHQRINRPTPSILPPPPDRRVARDNRVFPGKAGKEFRESSVSPHRSLTPPRAGARSDPILDPDPSRENHQGKSRQTRPESKRAAQDRLPTSLPADLRSVAVDVLRVLEGVQLERGGDVPTLRGVGLALARFRDRDHISVVRELEHWALAGRGQAKPVKDWARTFATFLDHAVAGRPTTTSNGLGAVETSAQVVARMGGR